MQSISQAILLESFPTERRGSAMAVFASASWLHWRWAFIDVPVGIVAVLTISRFIEDPPYLSSAKPGRMDAIGLGLLAVWLGALQIKENCPKCIA